MQLELDALGVRIESLSDSALLTALARHDLGVHPDLLARYRAPWLQMEEMLFSEWLADANSGRQPRPVRLTNGPSSDEAEMVMVPSALLTESLHAKVKGKGIDENMLQSRQFSHLYASDEKSVNAFTLHMATRHHLTVQVLRDERGDTVVHWRGNEEKPKLQQTPTSSPLPSLKMSSSSPLHSVL